MASIMSSTAARTLSAGEVAFDAAQLSSRHKSGVALRFPRIARIRRDINDCMRKYNDKYRVVLAKIMADPGK